MKIESDWPYTQSTVTTNLGDLLKQKLENSKMNPQSQRTVTLQTQITANFTDGKSIVLKPHLIQMIQKFYRYDKVESIKYLRAEFNIGLKEAKDLADLIAEGVF